MKRALRRTGWPCLLLGLVMLSAGCVYTPLTPLGAQVRADALDPDERHLWKQSLELEHELAASGLLFEDPELAGYLTAVLDRVTTDDLTLAGVEPEVHVISDVHMNAFAFANGVIYVHTALLARIENESQLATMLSRELAHVIHRHTLRAHRDRRAQADVLAWVGVGATTVQGGGMGKLLLQASSLTSMAAFHQVLENEADAKGLETLAGAGYDVREAPRLFQLTVDYLAETHRQGPWAQLPFAAPPHMTARISGYEGLIASRYAGAEGTQAPISEPAEFRRRMHPAAMRQASLELAAGLPESAEKTARLATESNPADPEAWVLLGRALDARRKKPMPGRSVPAVAEVRGAFERALALDRRHAIATRELGMSFYRGRDGDAGPRSPEATAQALRHLRRYLTLDPAAEDASYVRSYIRELSEPQTTEGAQ